MTIIVVIGTTGADFPATQGHLKRKRNYEQPGKPSMKILSLHAVAIASVLILAGPPASAADDNQPKPIQDSPAASTARAGDPDASMEDRIQKLHDQLRIAKDQDGLWQQVAKVMRDNAAATRASYRDRDDRKDSMTAVDDIRSYQAVTAERADGLAKLADAFAPLYAAMPEAQQKNADAIFGHKTDKAKRKAP